MVAMATIGSGLLGGLGSMFGANAAARAQQRAASEATALHREMFNRTQENLQPFIDFGQSQINPLMERLPGLSAPIDLSQEWLESTPGYKFNLGQGMKAVTNMASSRGLGSSGAALRGGATFATGLADSTYQQQFSNELANRAMQLNTLMAPINVGQNAAASLGQLSGNVADSISGNIIGAGNARAGANIAMGNAFGGMGNTLMAATLAPYMFPGAGGQRGQGLYGSGTNQWW